MLGTCKRGGRECVAWGEAAGDRVTGQLHKYLPSTCSVPGAMQGAEMSKPSICPGGAGSPAREGEMCKQTAGPGSGLSSAGQGQRPPHYTREDLPSCCSLPPGRHGKVRIWGTAPHIHPRVSGRVGDPG